MATKKSLTPTSSQPQNPETPNQLGRSCLQNAGRAHTKTTDVWRTQLRQAVLRWPKEKIQGHSQDFFAVLQHRYIIMENGCPRLFHLARSHQSRSYKSWRELQSGHGRKTPSAQGTGIPDNYWRSLFLPVLIEIIPRPYWICEPLVEA